MDFVEIFAKCVSIENVSKYLNQLPLFGLYQELLDN